MSLSEEFSELLLLGILEWFVSGGRLGVWSDRDVVPACEGRRWSRPPTLGRGGGDFNNKIHVEGFFSFLIEDEDQFDRLFGRCECICGPFWLLLCGDELHMPG